MDEQFTEQDIASALRQLQKEGCLRRPADDPLMMQLADSQLVARQDAVWVATVKDLSPWINALESVVVAA